MPGCRPWGREQEAPWPSRLKTKPCRSSLITPTIGTAMPPGRLPPGEEPENPAAASECCGLQRVAPPPQRAWLVKATRRLTNASTSWGALPIRLSAPAMLAGPQRSDGEPGCSPRSTSPRPVTNAVRSAMGKELELAWPVIPAVPQVFPAPGPGSSERAGRERGSCCTNQDGQKQCHAKLAHGVHGAAAGLTAKG